MAVVLAWHGMEVMIHWKQSLPAAGCGGTFPVRTGGGGGGGGGPGAHAHRSLL